MYVLFVDPLKAQVALSMGENGDGMNIHTTRSPNGTPTALCAEKSVWEFDCERCVDDEHPGGPSITVGQNNPRILRTGESVLWDVAPDQWKHGMNRVQTVQKLRELGRSHDYQ